MDTLKSIVLFILAAAAEIGGAWPHTAGGSWPEH